MRQDKRKGITGLIAVCVLLYVSNWLFQKTYIHDWKDYLKKHVGAAIGSGSALAMASAHTVDSTPTPRLMRSP